MIQKPHIRRLGQHRWVCIHAGGRAFGFGDTPTQAYREWERKLADTVDWRALPTMPFDVTTLIARRRATPLRMRR